MARSADIVILGAVTQNDNGVPVVQAVVPLTDDTNDVEPFGEVDMMQCLGVTSVPWPKDDKGHAEGVVIPGAGNRDGVIVGARDTRCAKIAGKLKPGDTVVHSTGPNQSAQLQLKEESRQAALATTDAAGKGMIVLLDGKAKEIQISGFGMLFKMSPSGITLTNGDATILMQGKTIALGGEVILGGLTPNPAQKLMTGPPTGSPGGPASVPLLPAMGVAVGS